jgi:hypothetical protein
VIQRNGERSAGGDAAPAGGDEAVDGEGDEP